MTDYSELVTNLREYLITRQISDLLEAQAKEIAELENKMTFEAAANLATAKLNANLLKRIAELEAENKALRAALKPFADRYGEITKMLGGVTQDYAVLTVDVGFGDLCTAHAALKGEK